METISILSILANFGTPAIIALIIIYLIYIILTNFLSAKVKNWFSGGKNKEEKNELKFHTFFANAQYRLISEIPLLELCPEKPVKQQMFRDLIAIEVQTIYDICLQIIELDMAEWSPEQWKTEIFVKINEILSKKMIKSFEIGIPPIVMAKYNKWHESTYETLYEYVTILAASPVYCDNFARTDTLLLIMNLMLIMTIADAERSLGEINGEIAGKSYKDMILED